MRKLKTIIFVLLSIFITLGCASQDKTNSKKMPMYNFNLTKYFETFDSVRYNRLHIKGDLFSTEYLNDSTYIEMSDGELQKSYIETPPNSYFELTKIYYPNGNIKMKGIAFIDFFQAGIWYEFDEAGKLVKETDYEQYFKFIFEDILKFCEARGIPIKKSLIYNTGNSNRIRRKIENGKAWWEIDWEVNRTIWEKIKLDGMTGEILN